MGEKDYYDPDARDKIAKAIGDSDSNAATLIASTEMGGVAHDKEGNLDGRQTYCNILEYSEDLEDSPGMKEGRRKCVGEVKTYLKKKGLKSVDAWIKEAERKKAEQASSTTS